MKKTKLAFPLKKSRSQHFLQDKEILSFEAEKLEVSGEDVLEIGAGDGRLSEQLLSQNPSSLTLVELDERWAEHLRKRFSKDSRVRVMEGDVLSLPDSPSPAPLIAGNIPYQITSSILLKLGRWKPKRALICVQKEVAERISAPPGSSEYGRLSVFVQAHFETKLLGEVARGLFTPPPKVDSALLLLTRRKRLTPLPAHFETITAALFSHRLQTVAHALMGERRRWGWSKDEARERAGRLKISRKRVFELTPAEAAELAQILPAPISRA
ncbi:MAG: 16S rRNA (adenine(1518)-N(6)/adenine(1519)-N(6))-dimethyltransferase RsmA [Candidatus Marsarchaeota archaeon]|nr:16S rRNA (adenine(1518)-N(6)/adenine(1519)-N(6))-dimethyltransferase RsmA [Candidatus Marsarchaeota archaeon]